MVDRSVATIRRSHLIKLANEGKRLDGRRMDMMRDLEIYSDVISDYDGSARIRLGGTELIAAIHIEKGRPYPNLPESGTMHTTLQMHPMASPRFGKEDMATESVEISRVIDRGIRNSGAIDMDSLVITPGEEVWSLFVDILVIDFDGNLFDSSHMALIKALETTPLPFSRYDMGENKRIPIQGIPISTTFVKLGGKIMYDPTALEERVADARITLVIDDDSHLRSLQKGGRGVFNTEEIMETFKRSTGAASELRRALLNN